MKVRRDVKEQSVEAKIAVGQSVAEACTANASASGLTTKLTAMATATANLSTAHSNLNASQDATAAAAAAQTTASNAYNDAYEDMAITIESTPGMTEEKALSLGVKIYHPGTAAAIGVVAAPQNLVVTTGDFEKTLDASLDKVHGAGSYVFQVTQTPDVPASWQLSAISKRSSCTLENLESGKHYWVRAAAIGTAGQGPWSAQAEKQVP